MGQQQSHDSTKSTSTDNHNITTKMTKDQYQQFQKFLQQNNKSSEKSAPPVNLTVKNNPPPVTNLSSTPISQLPKPPSVARRAQQPSLAPSRSQSQSQSKPVTYTRPTYVEPENTVNNQFSQLQQERLYSQPNSTYHPQPRMDVVLQSRGKLSNVKDQYQNVYQQRQFDSNSQYYNTLQYHGQVDKQQHQFQTSQHDMHNLRSTQTPSTKLPPPKPSIKHPENRKEMDHSPKINLRRLSSDRPEPKTGAGEAKHKLSNELTKFAEKYDPYALLGVRSNADLSEIKRAYRKQAKKVHPDAGGSEEAFKLLATAYLSILESKKAERSNRMSYQEMKQDSQDYVEDQGRSGPAPLGTGQGFNRQKFNELFDETRLDEVVDEGYSDWINQNPSSGSSTTVNSKLISDKFSLNVFNSTFERQRNEPDTSNEESKMVQYSEPLAAQVSKINFTELGQSSISDFGKSASIENDKSLNYTDYRQAMTHTHLINQQDREVKRPQYRDVEELEKARESISYTMDTDQRKHYDEWQHHEASLETMRQDRLRDRDTLVGNRYNDVQRVLLGSEYKTLTTNSRQ